MYPRNFNSATRAATIAATRFGYGAKLGEIEQIAQKGAVQWLVDQIYYQSVDPHYNAFFFTDAVNLAGSRLQRHETGLPFAALKNQRTRMKMAQYLYPALAGNLARPVYTQHSFHERLVRFWMNLFVPVAHDPFLHPFILTFEQQVVRRFMHGSYYDLILAALRHPALLMIYQNILSAGRLSEYANNDNRFLNPQLARMVVERLTIGVNHLQATPAADAFANMLTGWSIEKHDDSPYIGFKFNEGLHQPGVINLLGKPYPDAGALQAEAGLYTLVTQPETATNLAFRLVQHFISDTPDRELVDKIALTYLQNGGSLPAMLEVMVRSNQAFNSTLLKIKTPEDLVFSYFRGFIPITQDTTQPEEIGRQIIAHLTRLGQPPLYGRQYKGWSDKGEDWLLPTLYRARIDWCQGEALRLNQFQSGAMVADHAVALLGFRLTRNHYQALANKYDPMGALRILLVHPIFQRR